jgi:ectoine hydroxylase-related dioxygenase (phytanoyl-CoA dioxygenase family)
VLRCAGSPDLWRPAGNRRFQSPLDLSDGFNTPQLYANPFVLPILKAVLGDEMVLGACGAVTSLPGAQEQHVHRDGPPLFNKAVNRMAPAHGVNFFVPLVEFNEMTGTTRIFPGTQTDTDLDPKTAPQVDPIIPLGSCLLMDYRLFHQGRANRSEKVRPLLYFVYHQPWFKDYKNHGTVPFLKLSEANYAKIPPEHRKLLAWTEHYRTGLY